MIPGIVAQRRRVGPPIPFVAGRWRASDVSAPLSLANSDQRLLLAVNNSAVARTVPVDKFKSSGKWYCEILWVHVIPGTTTSSGCGVATSDFPFSTNNIAGGSGDLYAGLWPNSDASGGARLYRSGSFVYTTNIGEPDDGVVQMIAMDIDARKLWFGTYGVWNGQVAFGADPATGTAESVGSANLAAGKSWAPACSPWSSEVGAPSEFDILSGVSECIHTPPAGFSYW